MFFDLFKKKKLSQDDIKINEVLEEIRQNGKLPIYANADVLEALRFLAKNQETIKLDDYTKGEILKIYNKWQEKINKSTKSQEIIKVKKGNGFEPKEVEQEYITEVVWYNQEDGRFDYCEPQDCEKVIEEDQ